MHSITVEQNPQEFRYLGVHHSHAASIDNSKWSAFLFMYNTMPKARDNKNKCNRLIQENKHYLHKINTKYFAVFFIFGKA